MDAKFHLHEINYVYILLVDFKQEGRLNFLENTIITHFYSKSRTLDIKSDGI